MKDHESPDVKRQPQVAASMYRRKYLSLVRLITHWYQADMVGDHAPVGGSVLEIGPGAGHTTWLLRNFGFQTTTLDFDAQLGPDIVGDVTNLPCEDKSYDCVLCAEVLEHIPFAEFGRALKELWRVSRQSVVLTLPAPFVGLSMMLNIAGLPSRGFHLGVPYRVQHQFDGEHYWEIGKRGYSLATVKDVIRDSGFTIHKAFRPVPSLYAYFFVLHPV